MGRFLLGRLAQGAVVVFGVTTLAFFLTHLTGDPARVLLPLDAKPEDLAAYRRANGLDRALQLQYLDYLARAARGDLGLSLRYQQPALGMVLDRLGPSAQLAAVSLAIALLLGVPLGVLAALRPRTWLEQVAMTVALLGQSMPVFWLGIVLILVVGVQLRWLPVSGSGTPLHLLMPGLTLSLYTVAIVARLLRANLIEVLSADYIRTARAKGLADRAVVLRHAIKNAAVPVVTVFGLQVGFLLGSAVIVEQVFAYPGMGQLVVQAIGNRDVAVVQAFVVVIGAVIVAVNLLVDLLYLWLDPRVQYG